MINITAVRRYLIDWTNIIFVEMIFSSNIFLIFLVPELNPIQIYAFEYVTPHADHILKGAATQAHNHKCLSIRNLKIPLFCSNRFEINSNRFGRIFLNAR